MPIYSYECIYCTHGFDEIRRSHEKSGKSICPKCGNVSFKVPAIFSTNIFKKREFADGTSTPDNVRTPSQEKKWKKSEGITYDTPIAKRRRKSNTAMEDAFKKAHDKVKQGYKIEDPQLNKNFKKGGNNVKPETVTR